MRWILLLLLAGCAVKKQKPPTLFAPIRVAHTAEVQVAPRVVPAPRALPPILYPTNGPAAFWVLQWSDDLKHWHLLSRFVGDYPDTFFVPTKTGNRFFRYIGTPQKPAVGGNQTNRPDLWIKLRGDEE